MKKTIYYVLFLLVFVLLGCESENRSAEDTQTEQKKPIVEASLTNWKIKLIAEDPVRRLKIQSTEFGALEGLNEIEKYALKGYITSPGGYSNYRNYLDIAFLDPVGVSTGLYKTSYHAYAQESEDSWSFTVYTDDTSAQILLSWHGLYKLTPYIDDHGRTRFIEYRSLTHPFFKQMKLVDMQTGDEIPAVVDSKIQTYTFTMNGQSQRTFKWVVETDEVNITSYQPVMSSLQAKAIRKDANLDTQTHIEKKSDAFDLSKVPGEHK